MKHIFTLLFFSLLTNISSAEGAYGTYTIVGTAYGADSVSLKKCGINGKVWNRNQDY
ncbi:MAG: hypothetical protein SGJ15_07270 [Bacteroidota bacterium]|nr:hypothetical protein [Bacteroidota bacterium]